MRAACRLNAAGLLLVSYNTYLLTSAIMNSDIYGAIYTRTRSDDYDAILQLIDDV